MNFLRIAAAVLVGNFITLVVLLLFFAFLISGSGQAFMRSLGYDITPLVSAYHSIRIIEWQRSSYTDTPAASQAVVTTAPLKPSVSPPAKPLRQVVTSSSSPAVREDSAIKSSLQSCRFWNDQYRKDGSFTSKKHRDAACRRYEELSGRDVGSVVTLYSKPRQMLSSRQSTNTREEQKREREKYCKELRDSIDECDSMLRAGGDGEYMTYWRRQRREVSNAYYRECR